MSDGIRDEFKVHKLNDLGMASATGIARLFSHLLTSLEAHTGADGRDVALVRTHLQLASFYAKRAMATKAENQQVAITTG